MSALSLAWQAIVAHPLFWIGVTLAAYQLGVALYEKTRLALFHPVMISIVIMITVLLLIGVDFPTYREAVAPLLVLLGPATVALAVPLYVNLRKIRDFFWPVMLTLLLGGLFATISTLLIGWALQVDHMLLMTMAPKSVTSPIAMLVAEQIGGVAALAAVFVMITAIIGALFGPWLLKISGIRSQAAWGLAMGICAHAVGTARALEESEEAGAFAALGMSLMGIATAILLPLGMTLWWLWLG
ncbi:MAG: hypothetical protein CVV07_11245 [Gammaproteobacteria bacterium HGW-Gammaproteobacteria-11]|nr:MAG: hypothetical protein CVV07_11245 [Gammaproteobacteria bacterium HGW-Gammaproteobacteria-11]